MNARLRLICIALLLVFTIGFSRAPAHEQDKLSKPEALFEELWGTFSERYAFFELRGVDWEAQRRKYRPLVNAETSDEQLFELFCKMLKPLLEKRDGETLPFDDARVIADRRRRHGLGRKRCRPGNAHNSDTVHLRGLVTQDPRGQQRTWRSEGARCGGAETQRFPSAVRRS